MRATWLLPLVLVTATAQGATRTGAHGFTFDDMVHLARLGDFDVSRDGKWVAYTVTHADADENKTSSALWLAAVDGATPPRQLTAGVKKDRDPRFAPDGKTLAFVSDREGTPQIYTIDLAGGEPRRLTSFALGVEGPLWAPDGKFLVAAAEVYPECKDAACNAAKAERASKAKIKARVIERLLFRHWDDWRDGKRVHLFRVPADGSAPRDLTPGDVDSPSYSMGARHYDIAPDGKSLVFASNHDRDEANSTNSDIWELRFSDGKVKCLSCANKAFDGEPRYSPDGARIAWTAQSQPGFESDEFDLVVYDRAAATSKRLTTQFPDWVDEQAWMPDGKHLVFSAVHRGRKLIYSIDLDGKTTLVRDGMSYGSPTPLPDGTLVYMASSLTRAPELFHDGKPLSRVNDYGELKMGDVSERWVAVADGQKEQAWVVTPPGFDPHKKYPALFWVHGGPQSAFEDIWSWRWNPEVLATAGYVVYMPNPRGSVGYGQPWVNGVSKDWGGVVFDDLMRAADDLEKLPFVDKKRIGAAGASFGGFMMNWFQGHTRRFVALFCHDGIANQAGQYATEELWFPEWELGGKPWQSELYKKFDPAAAAKDFHTPELIVHGERDYRIPSEQAYLMFTLLQRQNIPSRLVVFPDENHWVLKPGNSRLWYAEMEDWFHHWLGGAPADQKALDSAYSVTK